MDQRGPPLRIASHEEQATISTSQGSMIHHRRNLNDQTATSVERSVVTNRLTSCLGLVPKSGERGAGHETYLSIHKPNDGLIRMRRKR